MLAECAKEVMRVRDEVCKIEKGCMTIYPTSTPSFILESLEPCSFHTP